MNTSRSLIKLQSDDHYHGILTLPHGTGSHYSFIYSYQVYIFYQHLSIICGSCWGQKWHSHSWCGSFLLLNYTMHNNTYKSTLQVSVKSQVNIYVPNESNEDSHTFIKICLALSSDYKVFILSLCNWLYIRKHSYIGMVARSYFLFTLDAIFILNCCTMKVLTIIVPWLYQLLL